MLLHPAGEVPLRLIVEETFQIGGACAERLPPTIDACAHLSARLGFVRALVGIQILPAHDRTILLNGGWRVTAPHVQHRRGARGLEVPELVSSVNGCGSDPASAGRRVADRAAGGVAPRSRSGCAVRYGSRLRGARGFAH